MNTNNWKLDLFSALDAANSIQSVMDASVAAVRPFGFDFCAWRLASEKALQGNHVSISSSNDPVHQTESTRGYDDTPCSHHCAASSVPFTWLGTTDDAVFKQAPELFEEYYSLGHRAGWAKSMLPDGRCYSMFYAESTLPFTSMHMHYVNQHMEWVYAATYVRINEFPERSNILLTDEQKKILSLFAQGIKRVNTIADTLHRPENRIKIELSKALFLLDCTDINTAVARAIFLGLLY